MATLVDLLFRTVDGVFAVDAKQRIILWNPACAQLFGIPDRKALGRCCGEVVRGQDPLGKPLCTGQCSVARLANGENAPNTFPLKVSDGNGGALKLSVSIVLVPSPRQDQWTYVHLLHRGAAPDTLDVLKYDYGARQPRSVNRHEIHADGCSRPNTGLSLTARERQILRLLGEGLPVSQMSRLLNISPVTVRNHIRHIEVKLDVHSKLEAVVYAYRHNLI
jgi:DNA-binding CsgD family transcriptional regulator